MSERLSGFLSGSGSRGSDFNGARASKSHGSALAIIGRSLYTPPLLK